MTDKKIQAVKPRPKDRSKKEYRAPSDTRLCGWLCKECGHHFTLGGATYEKRINDGEVYPPYYGLEMILAVCPKCGSHHIELNGCQWSYRFTDTLGFYRYTSGMTNFLQNNFFQGYDVEIVENPVTHQYMYEVSSKKSFERVYLDGNEVDYGTIVIGMVNNKTPRRRKKRPIKAATIKKPSVKPRAQTKKTKR